MYSDSDLDAAVAAGVLSPQVAAGFRDFIATRRATPAVDEEHFRLLTGFNDIFVAIALALVLGAAGWLGARTNLGLGGMVVATLSWGLAEFFTRKRRMALPSILLLIGFVGGVFLAGVGTFLAGKSVIGILDELKLSFCAAISAAAAWAHWRRFMVPVTIAAGVCAAILASTLIIIFFVPALSSYVFTVLMPLGGLATFILAMVWDSSDRSRVTRRSDVAFWLHLSAAPMLVHPAFTLLEVAEKGIGELGVAVGAVGIYLVLAVLALAVDRRALLVSALIYVFFAVESLFHAAGLLETATISDALAALVIGSGLLLLSVFWHRARRLVVESLPRALQARLPPVA